MSLRRLPFAFALLLPASVVMSSCSNGDDSRPSATNDAQLAIHRDALDAALKEDPFPGQLSWLEMEFRPFVFDGDAFPKGDFKQRDFVRKALGNYTITTTYYNEALEEVSTPDRPGRYAAVAHVSLDSGLSFNRYYTLFKQPGKMSGEDWWRWASRPEYKATITLPDEMGIQPAVAEAYARNLSTFLKFGFYEDLATRPYAARLLAGLYESRADGNAEDPRQDLIMRDRRFWLSLKRKLSGQDKENISLAGPIAATEAAPVLRTGTAAEAGMKADVVRELDDLCTRWAQASNEGFGVALARNGVVFFHKAYGMRDGVPMTTDTKSHMASIQKVMTGIVVMALVRQGTIRLDDDVQRFFPGLRDVKPPQPITLRHLLTHSSGLPDMLLDEAHDLEEIIKIFLASSKVGQEEYSETGYSLVGRMMELMSGQTTADIFARNLLGPLGMDHTEVKGAASDAWSTPLDMAKIGQLVLNGGTYGEQMFYGAAEAKQMLPSGLERTLDVPNGNVGRGIGIHKYNNLEASAKTSPSATATALQASLGFGDVIGHGASSGATFSIDLDNKLVIVMTRNHRDEHFNEYNRLFMEAIARNMVKP